MSSILHCCSEYKELGFFFTQCIPHISNGSQNKHVQYSGPPLHDRLVSGELTWPFFHYRTTLHYVRLKKEAITFCKNLKIKAKLNFFINKFIRTKWSHQ